MRCSNCHSTLLNAFTSLAGVSIRPVLKSSVTKLAARKLSRWQTLSTCSSRCSELVPRNHQYAVGEENEEFLENEQTSDSENNIEPASSVPWYLQVDPPQRPYRPLSERQQLPELPLDPPPLLQPILEYISTDLGLDDLSIFDLRKIDPPPALGASLLMILGTARSEKHLHVSADRFCRWLRTTHKLSPYPDGLLGRGELKLKLRRKARRARLLSSVGSSENSAVDDGLRTGWVCVNVGTIEDGGATVEEVKRPEGFVGFGDQVTGSKVVIQMLTEEKREELDLEELWGGMLARQERKEARRLTSLNEGLSDQASQQEEIDLLDHTVRKREQNYVNHEVGRAFSFPKELKSDSSSYPSKSPTNPPISNYQQTRNFHSRPESFLVMANDRENVEYEGLDSLSVEPNIQTPLETAGNGSLNTLPAESNQHKDQTQQLNDTANIIVLRALLKHLRTLPEKEARRQLGSGIKDFSSTPFLKSFYQALPLTSDVRYWEYRLSLVCYALKLAHRKYYKHDLWRLYCEMQASVIYVPPEIFVMVLKVFLVKVNVVPWAKRNRGLSPLSVECVYKVLEDMLSCGHNIMTEEIRRELTVAIILERAEFYSSEHPNQARVESVALQHLKRVLDQHKFDPSDAFVDFKSHLRILRAYANVNNWKGFWKYWHGIARCMQRRSEEIYLLMFRRVARAGRQAHCIKTLRTCVPLMSREQPPVKLDVDLAKAVMDCVKVAEPETAAEAREGQSESGEWVRLWRRCERQLNPYSTN